METTCLFSYEEHITLEDNRRIGGRFQFIFHWCVVYSIYFY